MLQKWLGQTCSIYCSLCHLVNVFQKLRLGSPWVPQQKHVDISSQAMCSTGVFLLTSKQCQCNSGLDIGMAINARSNTFGNSLSYMRAGIRLWILDWKSLNAHSSAARPDGF